MTIALGQYCERRRRQDAGGANRVSRAEERLRAAPLLQLADAIARQGPLSSEALADLADRMGLPIAAVRSAVSYYHDLPIGPDAVRVCHGTSCMLAGADSVRQALGKDHDCATAYCLGYCDRSPAVLRQDGRVASGLSADASGDGDLLRHAAPARGQAADRPDIRCVLDEPIVTARIIHGDHSQLDQARAAGVYQTLARALTASPDRTLSTMVDSGERGRGGAGYPTGAKWRACAATAADQRYVIANGDEGDPGSFIDRVLMEDDPHALLEGMALCGWAVGASRGIVFIRSEYPRAIARVRQAIDDATAAGLLGDHIQRPDGSASDFSFHVSVFPGMGSYVCGEETALINAIEGFRGEVKLRPPYPTEAGLFGKPTVVNNVETLVNVPWIIGRGAAAYRRLGTRSCPGSKAICLNHGFARPGIVEAPFGTSLREIIEGDGVMGGGGRDGELEAVILGGPMGSILTPDQWDVPVCYQAMGDRGAELGHGGIVAVPRGTNWLALLLHWLAFMQHESCGKCAPCRLGSAQAMPLTSRLGDGDVRQTFERLLGVMEQGSLCAFGQLMPGPMRTILAQVMRHGQASGGPPQGADAKPRDGAAGFWNIRVGP